MLSPSHKTQVTVVQPTEAELLAAMDERWVAEERDERGRAAKRADVSVQNGWQASTADPNLDGPASPETLEKIRAMFAEGMSAASGRGGISTLDQTEYVERAVFEGRFGANVIARLFKSVMGPEMARDFGDELIAAFFIEHAPRTAAERALVEHAAIVHAQGLVCRARWAGTTNLADLDTITRVQSRLTSEFNRMLDALASQRDGRRVTIANASIGGQQIVNQNFGANEMGTNHVGP
jgi:hypothetical protein